jgi:uncharacterized membrane protein YfcA
MTTAAIAALIGTGLGAGFLSGLLGVGGGLIMTPMQYIVYSGIGLPEDIAVKVALATSLSVILPTATSGVLRHHRERVVHWRVSLIMGGTGLASAYGGATLAAHLSGTTLKTVFAVIVLAAAARMFIATREVSNAQPVNNPWLWAAWGVPVGLASGLAGIGGGMLAVPILLVALKFRMHDAIATSLGVVMITSIGGTVGYIVNGLNVPGVPPPSVGYVDLQSLGILAAASIGMAQVGARTAHRLPARPLKYAFFGILVYMGLRMLGVFG